MAAGALAVKSTFQAGGKGREGLTPAFKVISQEGQTTFPLTCHWPELSHMAPSGYTGVLEMSLSWYIAVSGTLGICY